MHFHCSLVNAMICCAGTASPTGVYDVGAPGHKGPLSVEVKNDTNDDAQQDDDMHDTTENEVVPHSAEDDFATADGFLRHVHSLRRLIFTPLPGGAGVRGVPGSTSTASLSLQGDAGGDSVDGGSGVVSTGGAAGVLPDVTIEVLKNATYEDVVQALASKLGQCAFNFRCFLSCPCMSVVLAVQSSSLVYASIRL